MTQDNQSKTLKEGMEQEVKDHIEYHRDLFISHPGLPNKVNKVMRHYLNDDRDPYLQIMAILSRIGMNLVALRIMETEEIGKAIGQLTDKDTEHLTVDDLNEE